MKKVLMIIIGFVLSGCTMMGGSYGWARTILSPTDDALRAVCRRAYNRGMPALEEASQISFKSKRGEVILNRGYNLQFLLCVSWAALKLDKGYQDSLSNPKRGRASVLLIDPNLDRATAVVRLELLDTSAEKKEPVSILPSGIETENNKTWFVFEKISTEQLAALDDATGINIVMNRGDGMEVYSVQPDAFPNYVNRRGGNNDVY